MIKNFFEKPVDRYIETVIKADDTQNIIDEVTEYVITNEITKKIRDFFTSYNNYAGANGVWISGFFGSGKSHLLKILSYVLSNKEFNGYKCGELFAEKIEGDQMLKADILRASKIPSESILFNIDQQSQITSKTDAKAILSVFYKVLYDHLGYYGFQPHVAEFEMWMDKQKIYSDFKIRFEAKHGKSWETARIDYFDPIVTDSIAAVLGEINNTDASKYESIMDDIEDKHKQSIEDFCDKVWEYIKSKNPGFRLNFFVDEVGQYISDNTKLMLNLQTIAESLATKTKGSSWILVTSQEDMEKVVGDMSRQQQNDFSRIQARFSIKIPLTSANVDEVIEKRLLKKTDNTQIKLTQEYGRIKPVLDTILSFSEAGVQFKGYKSDTDYANKFPFVPYQFDLFQYCRRTLSVHNVFQGKHAAIGERSMLGVFQQVVNSIESKGISAIVSFDLMFEGIRNELKGEIQSSINLAENNLDNKIAIKVLKTLFMVKYYGSFKTTKRNITVLLIDDVKIDLKKHESDIEEALNILENQNYIQRNGDLYEFMTNDEKDVEEDIKDTEIDDQAVTQHLKEIFYDEIIKDNRIRFIDNKQDYEFTSRIDGIAIGREKELEIDIITEFNYNYNNETLLQAQTMGSSGVKFILDSDPVFSKDIRLFLKTNKYVKINQSATNRAEYKRILQDKAQQNAIRGRNLIISANKILAMSKVFMNGSNIETSFASDGKTKVINVFQDLVRVVYPNLRMLGSVMFTEESIKTTLRTAHTELFDAGENNMSEAESEIIILIKRRKAQSDRTTLADLRTYFSKRPYGWYSNAIWTLVARLYKRGKLELKRDSNVLEDEGVVNSLLNSSYYPATILELPQEIDPRSVKKLKELYANAFDETCSHNEAKDVGAAFKGKLKDMVVDVNKLLVQKSQYPFLQSLSAHGEWLEKLASKEYIYYLNNSDEFEDELLDFKEDILGPIQRFMNGDQASIYDSIRNMLRSDTSNLDYIQGEETSILNELMKSDKPYLGNLLREAKAAKDKIEEKVKGQIEKEKETSKEAINYWISDMKMKDEFSSLSLLQQEQIIAPFTDAIRKIERESYIAIIRDIRRRIEEAMITEQLNSMIRLSLENKQQYSKNEGTDKNKDINDEPVLQYISKNKIKPQFNKTELQSEEDVDEYVESLRRALKEKIQDNCRIQL